MNKIDKLRNKINVLKQTQDNLELSDIFTEDQFEEEVIHEMYAYEDTNYHMRKIDEIMFNEAYSDYLDMLITDGFLENTEEYKDIQEEIEALEDEIIDLEEEDEEDEEDEHQK